jgi:ATP-dependent helicase HrpB
MTPLPDLPITDALPALAEQLGAGRNAVVVAAPGAGKTTLVPLALLRKNSGAGAAPARHPRRCRPHGVAAW